MPNRKIKHIVAKLVGASTEETLDVYDVDAVHTDKIYNGLDQTTDGYVLDARQGKALNDSLNSLLTWTSLGSTNGVETKSITLPETCQDVYVITRVTGTYFISHSLLYFDLDTTPRTFACGYYRNANEHCAVQWSISRTSVGLGIAYMNNTNYGTSAISYWFYR